MKLTRRSHSAVPRTLAFSALGVLAGAGLVRWQLQRLFTEEPEHELERRIGPVEVRRYPATLRAETFVRAPSWRDALDGGFRRMASYIFGANDRGDRVTMTSPVLAGLDAHPRGRSMAFFMPRAETLASLPEPLDTRVQVRQAPSCRVAVLRFHGAYGGDLTARKREELLAVVHDAGLEPVGAVLFAGYDPPSTLPFLRRNEVWVEVAGAYDEDRETLPFELRS